MHLCLFDIDGTLIDSGGAGQHAFQATLAGEFGVANIRRDVEYAGRSDRAIAMDLLAAHGVDATEENWQRFRAQYVRRIAEALPMRHGRVLPGVVPLLAELAQRGDVLIGLLTGNIREGARRKLSYYGLWHHFSFGGFGDDYVDRNDIAASAVAAAREYAARISATNGQPALIDGTTLVIGDTLNDIRCARSIGARCVVVPTGHTAAETLRGGRPDLLVETLHDAAAILGLLST